MPAFRVQHRELFVIDLLEKDSELSFLVVAPVYVFSLQRFPVVSNLLIWIIISDFPAREHFVKEGVQRFVESEEQERYKCHHQNGPSWTFPS
jgi:hypothetical protein